MIVVSDAGPLIYLGSVGRLALLRDLFGRVVVPRQVWNEVVGAGVERPAYPAALRDHLSIGLGVRQAADYGRVGVSQKVAHRMVRRAIAFVSIVQEGTRHGPES